MEEQKQPVHSHSASPSGEGFAASDGTLATKPTPGPWAVDPQLNDFDFGAPQRDGSRAQLCRYVHAPNGGGGRIAECFANCLVTTTEELEANARLIAAAPDLLAVVHQLTLATDDCDDLAQGTHYVDKEGRIRCKGSFLDLIERARALVAKVEA